MSGHAEGIEELMCERGESHSALAAAAAALDQAAEARDEARKLARYYRSLLLRQGDPVAGLVRHDPWDYPWVRGPWDEEVDQAQEEWPQPPDAGGAVSSSPRASSRPWTPRGFAKMARR
jgi:hypothetical protein